MAENEFTYKAVKDETMARKEMPNNLYCLTISLAVKPDCITLTGSFA